MRKMWIKIITDEAKVGGLLADLSGKVDALDYGVIEDVPYNKNKTRVSKKLKKQLYEKTGRQVILSALLSAPGHTANSTHMRAAFTKAGRPSNSLWPSIHAAKWEGLLKSPKPAVYKLTAKGIVEAQKGNDK
jgi:hypothetical protein